MDRIKWIDGYGWFASGLPLRRNNARPPAWVLSVQDAILRRALYGPSLAHAVGCEIRCWGES